jgi:hypothetical protein
VRIDAGHRHKLRVQNWRARHGHSIGRKRQSRPEAALTERARSPAFGSIGDPERAINFAESSPIRRAFP